MFEIHPTFHLCNEDSKSLMDTLTLFDRDLHDIDSQINSEEKEHFLHVVNSVGASSLQIC